MKRDWECIRAILVALEGKGDSTSQLVAGAITGFDPETVYYNMKLMIDAELIEGTCNKGGRMLVCTAYCMRWSGHELLDKISSEGIWNRVKSIAREQAVPLSFHMVSFLSTKALEALFR